MICKTCKQENKTSRVHIGESYTMRDKIEDDYYDESGDFVQGKEWVETRQAYRCSNGHEWIVIE